jgi:hypothetical protein
VDDTAPGAEAVRVVRRGDRARPRVDGGITSALLGRPVSPAAGWELHTVRFAAGTHQVSGAHASGVRELVHVHGGRLRAGPLAAPVELAAGDFADYAADVRHVYEALGGDAEATILTVDPGAHGDD